MSSGTPFRVHSLLGHTVSSLRGFLSLEMRHGTSRPGFVAFVAPPAPRVAPTFPKGPGEKKTTHSAVSARHWAAAIFRVSRSRRHGCFQIKLAQHSTLGLRLVGNQREKGLQTRSSFAVLLLVYQEVTGCARTS